MPSATRTWWPPATSRAARTRRRTPQQETADAQANAARQQYEAALNGARQGSARWKRRRLAGGGARATGAGRKGLADTTIRAPFDGYVTARPVAAGEYVGLTNKIATIVAHRHAEAAIADARTARRPGQTRDGRGGARVGVPGPRVHRQGDRHQPVGGPEFAHLHRGGALR